MDKQLSIIPKPVSIEYGEGIFETSGTPNATEKIVPCIEGAAGFACEEAYKLIISTGGICIEAASKKGLFRGQQTLRQLVLSETIDGKLTLPCAVITDYPRFIWRGFLLDSARYFYSVPFILRLLDNLALHHINRFHWHLTDDQGWRLPVKKYPRLMEIGSQRQEHRLCDEHFIGGFYTEEEIKQVVDYAAQRYIEIIPEVDLPGHASSILASYPNLGCTGGPYKVEHRFGIFEDVLCAGNDEVFELIEEVFDTLVKLFPSKWVHMGGDEVLFNRWEACPKCQAKQKELRLEKPSNLQSWITHKLVHMLAEKGRIAIGWDEILDDCEKFHLPKETIVMSWRGEEGGEKASSLGHEVIMVPSTHGCYLDYKHIKDPDEPGRDYGVSTVHQGYTMDPVTPNIKKENAHLILGGQCNMWSELIYAGKIAEYMIFPRVCAIAEAVWTQKENKNFEDFSARLQVHRRRLHSLGINQYLGPLE